MMKFRDGNRWFYPTLSNIIIKYEIYIMYFS